LKLGYIDQAISRGPCILQIYNLRYKQYKHRISYF